MRQNVLGVLAGVAATSIWGGLYIGVISTAVSTYLWVKCFELLDAGIAAPTFFAQPAVGALRRYRSHFVSKKRASRGPLRVTES